MTLTIIAGICALVAENRFRVVAAVADFPESFVNPFEAVVQSRTPRVAVLSGTKNDYSNEENECLSDLPIGCGLRQ
jgi:hypothetical protein